MTLIPFDKLVIIGFRDRTNAQVIGVKPEQDGSETYMIQPLRVDFTPHRAGSRLIRINSKEIENKSVNIEKHTN